MPAEVWRTRPARSIRRCETICASAGFSFMVGRKYWLIRILVRSLLGCLRVAADCRKRGFQRQTRGFVLHGRTIAYSDFPSSRPEREARSGETLSQQLA